MSSSCNQLREGIDVVKDGEEDDGWNTFDNFEAFNLQRSISDEIQEDSISGVDHDKLSIETGEKKKVSDAVVYGPRFCAIFEAFCKKHSLQIDVKRHLMSLCIEHIVTFIKWARESDTQSIWIGSMLLDNEYLRPEVRNGVVMILVYTFCSMKATLDADLDMFQTLQDPDQGFGISNRFSLRIYNDPLGYMSFLKTTISALIDAGAIPDNERINNNHVSTNKKSKVQFENNEELTAFSHIQRILMSLYDNGNINDGKNMVQHIISYWQLRGKFVRNRRFISALNSLKHMQLPPNILLSHSNIISKIQSSVVSSLDQDDASAMESVRLMCGNIPVNNNNNNSVISHNSSSYDNNANSDHHALHKKRKIADMLRRHYQENYAQFSYNLSNNNNNSYGSGDDEDENNSVLFGGSVNSQSSFIINNNNNNKTKTSNNAITTNIPFAQKQKQQQHQPQLQSQPQPHIFPSYHQNMPNNGNYLYQQYNKSLAPTINNNSVSCYSNDNSTVHNNNNNNNNQAIIAPNVYNSSQNTTKSSYSSYPTPNISFGFSSHGSNNSNNSNNSPLMLSSSLSLSANETTINANPVRTLRFERIGLTQWDIKESQIYDIPVFIKGLQQTMTSISLVDTPLCFIDEKYIEEEMLTMSFKSNQLGVVSLLSELQQRKALITTWPWLEMKQFRDFILNWREYNRLQSLIANEQQQQINQRNNDVTANSYDGNNAIKLKEPKQLTLLEFWKLKQNKHNNALESDNNGNEETVSTSALSSTFTTKQFNSGLIAYEITINIAILVRSVNSCRHFQSNNDSNNITNLLNEDIWVNIYPNELQASCKTQSFGEFLEGLFPQLITIHQKLYQQRLRRQQQQYRQQYLQEQQCNNYYNNNGNGNDNDNNVSGMVTNALVENRVSRSDDSSPHGSATIIDDNNNKDENCYSESSYKCKYSSHLDVTVRYFAHKSVPTTSTATIGYRNDIDCCDYTNNSSCNNINSSSHNNNIVDLPKQLPLSSYQTIGMLSSPAIKVISRLAIGSLLHDFVIDYQSFIEDDE